MTATTSSRTPSATRSLADLIAEHANEDPSYWDFAEISSRSGGHGFFQYPAMMVPELQGALLDDLLKVDPSISTVYDPFMGSGTVMLEARYRGLSFHGTDINPMAVLLCDVKANPPTSEAATIAVEKVLRRVNLNHEVPLHQFLHSQKWFAEAVMVQLSRLRHAIMQEEDPRVRRFLWVCLAETVRLVSNSRISTFKLHLYAPDVLAHRKPNAIYMFENVGRSNAKRAGEHWERQNDVALSENPAELHLQRGNVSDEKSAPSSLVDVVMTSPPYGDNHTTVPYGQHSYLPLCWIDPEDMVGNVDLNLFATPSALDTASLGGSRAYRARRVVDLPQEHPSMRQLMDHVSGDINLEAKLVSFIDDYTSALKSISSRLKPNGYSLWTLGERRVKGMEMPLVAITQGVLESAGNVHVSTVTRRLKRKRMAGRNKTGATMGTEQILIMQKVRTA